jgi:hypothetical protein
VLDILADGVFDRSLPVVPVPAVYLPVAFEPSLGVLTLEPLALVKDVLLT